MNDVAEERTGHAAAVRDRCWHVGPELERTAGSDGLTFSNSIGLIKYVRDNPKLGLRASILTAKS
jgi:hypothetical protein